MYYLKSRYYDPEICRFINADNSEFLGTDSTLLSYNLFAYCKNNPVIGYDPTGQWDWGGVIAGLGIIAITTISIATFGIGTGLGFMIAAAALSTGVTMTYAAATDSAMVIDVSVSYQKKPGIYGKVGASMIIDFSKDGGIYGYEHIGGGFGKSIGASYSVGVVDNFNKPTDYSKHFLDVNASKSIGFDHCFDPTREYAATTKATSITLGGTSYGVGYDYYSSPTEIFKWRM